MKALISYEEARKDIKDGDIVFVSSSSIVARIIRFFTFSKYSHAGIAFWATVSGRNRLFMVEAQGGAKRRIVNMSFYRGKRLEVVESPRQWSEYANQALDRLGEVEYGWLEAAYVGLREFLLKMTKYIKLPRLDMPGEICSVYLARMLDLPPTNMSPQLLFEHLTKAGYKVRSIKYNIRRPAKRAFLSSPI